MFDKLAGRLTPEQVKHLGTALWLIHEGSRASGRTSVLATAYLINGMHTTNRWHVIRDHYESRNSFSIIASAIENIAQEMFLSSTYTLEFDRKYNLFRVTYNVK